MVTTQRSTWWMEWGARVGAVASLATAAGAQRILSDEVHVLVPGASTSPYSAALGDLDGDGDLDRVLGSQVYSNDGNGVFRESACSPLPTPFGPTGTPAMGDLDGDGDLDLLVGRHAPEQVWINDGSGCFSHVSAPPPVFGDDTTGRGALGDVDGDGDLDLVLANRGEDCSESCLPGNLRLSLNDGSGAFTDASAQIAPVVDQDPCAVALGDLDGDGDLDLVVLETRELGHAGSHRVLLNDGAGVFTDTGAAIPADFVASTTSLVLADLDGDADLDLVIGDGTLWRNVGAGGFVDATSSLPPLPWTTRWIDAADVDGDGDADLCVAADDGADRLLLNSGSGAFSGASGFPTRPDRTYRLALADIDADGDADVLRHKPGYVDVLFGDGAGAFVGVPRLWPGSAERTFAIATGDVDGDGATDVLGGAWGQTRLSLNRGNGEFVDGTDRLPSVTLTTCGVALADVDGDGDLDAVLANAGGALGEVESLYLNDGAGWFSAAPPGWWSTPADRSYTLAPADVDADGDVDLFVGNVASPDVLYFNDGSGRFAQVAGSFPSTIFNTYSSAFGDLDGDGDLDLITAGGTPRLFVNDGQGAFQEVLGVFPPTNTVTWDLALADIDVDGDLDLVHTRYTAPLLALYRNDGAGIFVDVSQQLSGATFPPFACRFVDLDRDGDLDLVAGPPLAFYENDGQATFALADGVVPRVVEHLHDLLFSDLDLDGDLDCVIGHAFAPAQVLPNLTRHLAWRTPPRIGRVMELELHGPAHEQFLLLATRQRGFVPFGNAGILQLKRSSLLLRRYGHFDAAGCAVEPYDVVADPALAGTSLYWQALIANPRKLTNLEITTFVEL